MNGIESPRLMVSPLLVAALTMVLVTTGAVAQESDDTPELPTSRSEFTFGGEWWTQSASEAKFQEFRQIPQGAFLESFLWQEWGGKYQWSLTGRDAMQKDQLTTMQLSRGARWVLGLEYARLPHLYSQIARTPYTDFDGTLTLPDSVRSENQNATNPVYTQNMIDLLNTSAGNVELRTSTDVASGRLRSRPAAGWTVDVTGEQRVQAGRQALGTSFGFSNAVEIAAPVDRETWDGEVAAAYRKKALTATASVGVSMFENQFHSLTVANPRRLTDAVGAPSYGVMSTPPDNRALRGKVALGYRFKNRGLLTGTASVIQGTQDEDWLPYTSNTALPQSNPDSLPGTNTDAEYLLTTYDARYIQQVMPSVGVTVRARHNEYDNRTPTHHFTGTSPYDGAWVPGPRENHAFGNSQTVLGGEVDWDAIDWLELTGLVEWRRREHTLREIEEDDENVFRISAYSAPNDALWARAGFQVASREPSDLILEDYENAAGVLIEQPGLRRFDVAQRDQTRIDASVGWVVGPRLDVSLDYEFLDSDYGESQYGLQSDRQQLVVADATLRLPRDFELTGGYGYGQIDTEQRSNETGTAPPPTADALTDWTANIDDRNVLVFARGSWWTLPRKMQFSLDYRFTRDLAEYDLNNGAGTAVDLPNTYYRRHEVVFQALYRPRYNVDIAARYGFDEYKVDDFGNQDVPLLTANAQALYLGNSILDYGTNLFAIVLTRRF